MTNLRWKLLVIVVVLGLAVWAFTPPSQKVQLGLDLKGGVHLVLRVQTDDALRLYTGILTLTVLLAALFIALGLLEAVMAFRMRPHEGWVWMLIAGLAALAVGVLILVHLPSSAAWAIGLLVGIKLIMSGFAYLFLPVAAARTV